MRGKRWNCGVIDYGVEEKERKNHENKERLVLYRLSGISLIQPDSAYAALSWRARG
jgi:hypothetical protein